MLVEECLAVVGECLQVESLDALGHLKSLAFVGGRLSVEGIGYDVGAGVVDCQSHVAGNRQSFDGGKLYKPLSVEQVGEILLGVVEKRRRGVGHRHVGAGEVGALSVAVVIYGAVVGSVHHQRAVGVAHEDGVDGSNVVGHLEGVAR